MFLFVQNRVARVNPKKPVPGAAGQNQVPGYPGKTRLPGKTRTDGFYPDTRVCGYYGYPGRNKSPTTEGLENPKGLWQ